MLQQWYKWQKSNKHKAMKFNKRIKYHVTEETQAQSPQNVKKNASAHLRPAWLFMV